MEIFSTQSEQELAPWTETEESLAFVCQLQMIKRTLCVSAMQLTLKLYLVGHKSIKDKKDILYFSVQGKLSFEQISDSVL